jgi:hypothetical protein
MSMLQRGLFSKALKGWLCAADTVGPLAGLEELNISNVAVDAAPVLEALARGGCRGVLAPVGPRSRHSFCDACS